jgi:hypothetical protein
LRTEAWQMGSGLNWSPTALVETVNQAVVDGLEPGEGIEATLPSATTGTSPWLLGFAALAQMVGIELMRTYGLVVTDRRVFLVRLRGNIRWRGAVEEARLRSEITVASYDHGAAYDKLELDGPASGDATRRLKLDVKRVNRAATESVVAALGGSGASIG